MKNERRIDSNEEALSVLRHWLLLWICIAPVLFRFHWQEILNGNATKEQMC